jgi:hypothetical protein
MQNEELRLQRIADELLQRDRALKPPRSLPMPRWLSKPQLRNEYTR